MRRTIICSVVVATVLAGVVGSSRSFAVSFAEAEAEPVEMGWIRGRVVGPDHEPTVGLTIGTGYSETQSLDSGEFLLDLEPGWYELEIDDDGSTVKYQGLIWPNSGWPTDGCSVASSTERVFRVDAGETTDAGEWVLQRLPDPVPVPPVPTGPRPDDWLGALNWYRAWSRVPPVEADPCENASQLLHIEYLLNSSEYMTGAYVSAHTENPESPWWTAEGANAAAHSNIGSYEGSRAIELWMQAPYHAMNLLTPAATVASFASSGGRAMLDSDRERLPSDSAISIPSPTIFPGDGSTVPLNKHTGENPSPIDSCPGWEAGPYRGLPLFVRDLANPVAVGAQATLRFPDGELVTGPSDRLCVITPHSDGPATRGAQDRVIVIYEDPLPDGQYTVTITGTGSPDLEGTFTIDTGFGDPSDPIDPDVGRFIDDDSSVFEADIEWMAADGITKGCNPPTNDRFCPDGVVTRGQMAAFLVRALDLTDRLDDPFVDDDDSIFQADIERLAAAGITKGCNPPTNDRFCPDGKVTREQMAAFLVRALHYSDDGGGDLFVDDDDSIFEADIDRLGTAGVTKGCNPPTNDRFCPSGYVTRGQMAAFLHRALG